MVESSWRYWPWNVQCGQFRRYFLLLTPKIFFRWQQKILSNNSELGKLGGRNRSITIFLLIWTNALFDVSDVQIGTSRFYSTGTCAKKLLSYVIGAFCRYESGSIVSCDLCWLLNLFLDLQSIVGQNNYSIEMLLMYKSGHRDPACTFMPNFLTLLHIRSYPYCSLPTMFVTLTTRRVILQTYSDNALFNADCTIPWKLIVSSCYPSDTPAIYITSVEWAVYYLSVHNTLHWNV